MPLDNGKLKQLYSTLQKGGYEQDYNTFVKGFTGNENYANRKQVYDLLTEHGAKIGSSYEEFMQKMQAPSAAPSNSQPKPSVPAPQPQKPVQKPTAATARPAQKAQQKGTPLSEAEKQKLLGETSQMLAQTDAGLRRTKNRMDYARANTGLHVPKVKLGERDSGIKLGQNSKVVATEPKYNPETGKDEQTFITESGNEFSNRAEADLEQNSVDDARYQLEHREDWLRQQRRALAARLAQRGQELDAEAVDFSWRDMPRGAGGAIHTYNSATSNGRLADSKYKNMLAQIQKIDDTLATLEEARKGVASDKWIDDSSNWAAKKGKQLLAFGAGAWRGLAHAVGKVSTWDMGLTDINTNMNVLDAAQNAAKYGFDNIDQDERDLLNLTAISNEVQSENADHIGRGYKAGEVTGESLPFMIEMILNPASGLGETAVKKMTREAIKRYGKEAVKNATKKYMATKIGTRLLGDATGSAIMAGTTGQGHVTADMLNRLTGDVQFKVDDTGHIVYGGREGAEDSVAKAYLKAFGAQTIENHSEMVGEYFAPLLGKASTIARKGMEKVGLGSVNRFIDNVGATNFAQMIGNFEKHAKWNGTIGEYAEEVVGNIENALLVGDNTLDTAKDTGVFNLDQNIDTFLGVSLMGGFLSGAKTLSYRGPKRQAMNEMSDAGKAVDRAVGGDIHWMEKWGGWRNTFLVGTDEEKKAALREVMDNTDLPINFRMGVLNFVKAAQKYEGLSRAQESKVQNGEQDPVAASYDESYDRGYDTTEPEAMNDAKNMLDMKRQQLAQQLGVENADELDDYVGDPLRYIDEQLKSGNTAGLQLMIDYANAKSAYEGMLQRVRDDIDSQVEESNHTVDSHVNRTDGMIHPATLKEQNEDGTDKSAYIVSGNVVMMDDGSGVDTEKSDGTIVIRDAQTGELSQVAPDVIMGMDEAIDPEEEKATAAAAIQQTMAQQAADRVDGTVSFAPGDNYTLTTPDGNQQAITIAANEQGLVDNGDGTVNVTVDGQTIVPMSKEEIQYGVDATNMARTAQAEQERLGQQAEAEQQRQAAEAEASRPHYGVNDIFTVNDENGMPVRGNVQGITEDGVEIYTEAPLNGKRVQVVPTEEFEGMVDSISDADGNPIWARGDNKPFEASPSLYAPLEEESAPLVDEATPSNEEAASAEPQPTALERVPKNDKGEPVYEQAEPETAWDAIVEQTGGNEQMAKTVADSMVADKEAALKKAEKAKAKQGGTIAEKIAAEQERQQAIDNAKAELKHWQSIAMTQQRRRADAERVKADEARKAAEARAEEEAKAKAEREEAERKEREAINGVPDWVDDTPQNARARGFRRSGGGKFDRQHPLVDSEYKPTEVAEGQAAPIHVGKEVDVKFTDKVKQKGRVAVVEASSIQPSHYHGQPNVLHFIPEAQPMKRTDDASVTSAEDIAANINPEEITSSVTAYTGAPSLNARGETIQGNNRSAALKQMWESHSEQAAKYKQYLMDHAEEYGLKAEDIAQMQQPVLVNMLDVDDAKAIELGQYDVKDTESGGTERIKAKNAVVKMGEDMKHFANVLLSSSDDEASFSQLVDKNGTSVLKWMNQKGYITPTQYKSAFDSKGNITTEAANDLKNIMYQSIFTDGNERLEEVFNTLPAKAQRAILATMYRDYDSPEAERMVTEVQSSIMAYNELMQNDSFVGAKNMKEAQMAVMMWQRQYQFDDATGESYLPTDKYSNFALQLAAMYRVQTQSLIQGTFNQMFDLIQGTQETTLFNQDTLDNTPRTLVEAIKEALNIDYNGQQRSNVLVGDSSASQQRRQGSRGAAEADGRGKSGNEPAEREGGTGSNSGQGAISKSNETEDIRQSEKVSEETEESVGRSLTKEEADELLSRMENNAEVSTEKELTAETWNETFDENNSIETPIGRVKMGENQITKFFDKNRTKEFGMVGPTLSNPDVIIEEKSEAKDGDSERQSSFLFVKTFNRNGEKIKFFASITVKQDGLEVSVSSHYLNKNKVSRTMQEGKVLYTREALLPNSSEWRLAEHQENDVPDLLPTQGSNASKNNEGLQNRFDGGAQTEHHPADVSVTTSHENGQGFSSADKVTNKGRELQTNNEKSAGSEQVKLSSKVEAASQEVNTHPTEAQKEAGNYKKGHVQVGTFDITIEQPEGSIRRGTDADGKQWESNMHNTYGYIRGTEGVDGDHIDVFISTDIDGWNGRKVFVVDQYNPDGTFDEHKVMLGFNDMDEAKSDYLANYEKGWENGRRITVSATNLEDFEKWIDSSHRKTKPFSEYSSVNKETVANTPAKVATDRYGIPTEAKMLWDDKANRNGEIEGASGSNLRITARHDPKTGETTLRVDIYDENAETPARIRTALEKEGYKIDTDGASSGFVGFDNYEDAKRFAEHVDEVQKQVDKEETEKADNGTLLKGEKWAATPSPEKFRTRKKGDSHDVVWHIAGKSYGSTTAERDLIEAVVGRYGSYVGAWNAYEEGKIMMNGNEAAILKAIVAEQEADAARGYDPRGKKTDGDKPSEASLSLSTPLNEEGEKRTKDIRDGDEDMYRIVDDAATIDRLESEPKMTAYRAMQVIDGRLYSPMAAKVDGRLTADNPMGAWTEAEETVFDFTPEQKAAMEKLDASGKKGDVEIIKGKLRYHKESEGGRGTLQFHLVKGDGTSLWAAYNPYIHSSLMMLNDQFTSAYKRPNIVVVEVEIPESELTSGYRAEHAKDPVGMAEWKAGPVAGQLPSDMGRKVMLSRWSKVKRIVPYSEVADHVASILQAAEAKKGKKLTLPIDSFHPELRKELEKRGFKFEYGQYTKEKTDKKGNVQPAWDEKSDIEKRKAYNGASYMDDAAIKELNDDFDGKWLKREGDGAYTDEEVSWENDPVSKMLGKSRWNGRQRSAFAARERERMASHVQELAERLHLDNVDIVTDASTLEGKRKRAKGFYNKRSGRITIVVPNHISISDVEQTLLHEAVAHYGLRELFGKQFDTFLDNVYQHAEFDTRQKIAGLARKNGWDFRKATEEYLASLAEDTDFEGMNNGRGFYGWWSFVKQSFLDMLHKIGFGEYDGPQLSDNELRYILWRSYENLKEPGRYRSILGEAEDMSKQMDLKVGNFAEREETPMDKASEEDLFRDGDNVDYEKAQARNLYEERVSRGMYQMQEALQDSMLGLKEAMDAVLKAEGQTLHIEDVAGYENAYLGENRLSSVNQAECEAFARTLFKPLLEEVARLAKTADERAELTDYMMAKHGLERNEVMARRAAAKACNDEFKAELRKAERAAAKDPLDQDAQDRLDDVKQRMHDREEELYFENRSRDYAGLTALTGMDNVVDAEAEAERMVKDYESSHYTAELWGKVFDVTQGTLSKAYESGLINKATYDDIRTMYKHYIPLRGFDEKTSDEAYAYLQDKHSAFNSPIRTARGRKSKADDPFANMESMAESAIMQGNRNVLVKQKFLNFVLNHPSDLVSVSDLWLRYDDAADKWKPVNTGDVAGTERLEETDSPADVERKMQTFEEAMQQLAANEPDRWKKQKDNPAIPYRVVESRDLRQHQVLVKRGGKDYLLTINGNPRAAQALNGQTNPDNDTSGAIGAILHAGEVLNRHLSAFYTTRNPDFVVSNFVRDALYANTSVWVKESRNYAIRFHKNFARVNPAKMKMLFGKLRKGTLDMNDETERMFHQFMMNGGETGYSNIRDIEQRKNDIKRELKKYNGKLPIRKAWDLLGERFDEYNRAVENCARFAAYMTSRQMKRSIDRSIYDAKEISVNFNKKGSGAKFMGAVGQTKTGNAAAFVSGLGRSSYVFWNAALQGTTNFGRIAKRHPKKAIAGMAAMFLLGVLAAGIGGDDGDDEDKNSYYNLPEYVRRSNIVFRLPWMKESWISIPLPVEYRSIYGMGELMTSVISGKEHYTGGEIASQMAGQMSQMLPIDFMEGGGNFKAFVPSAVKPYAEVMTNKGWTGMPLYKDTPYNQDMPEWTKAYKSANKYLVGLSETLNDISGGDAYTKGFVDINPAKVEYLLNGYFGGVSTTIDKLTKTAETIFGDREYDPRSFPILNRLMKNGDERTENRAINNEYFRLQKEHDKLKSRLKHYEDDTDNGVFDYAEKIDWLYNSPEYRRLEIFEDYAPDINAIVKELKEPMSDEERKQLEADLNEIKKELVEEVNETRKRK